LAVYRRNLEVGKVRPDHIKEIAHILIERFPNKFSSDFENNKKMVDKLTDVTSIKVRNRIAGYIIRLVKSRSKHKNNLENEVNG
jgi:small subunit ribosomal protein S17e